MAPGLLADAADAHDACVSGAHLARVPPIDAAGAHGGAHLARVPLADAADAHDAHVLEGMWQRVCPSSCS